MSVTYNLTTEEECGIEVIRYSLMEYKKMCQFNFSPRLFSYFIIISFGTIQFKMRRLGTNTALA